MTCVRQWQTPDNLTYARAATPTKKTLKPLVFSFALSIPWLISCLPFPLYRPGAADAAGPHARDPALVGVSPDDVAEDLFARKVGLSGRCLTGSVQFDDAAGGPVGRARIVARGWLKDPKAELPFETITKSDDAGRFSLCVRSVSVRGLAIRVEREGIQPLSDPLK